MGPVTARTYWGQQLVQAAPAQEPPQPAGRARREIDYGRRAKGYVFGALQPASGAALTNCYAGRSTANFVDFLHMVEAWAPAQVERVYAILDNLNAHKAADVLLFAVAHPRWEFVFQPTYAAYLNLIEPWWKTLRSLALRGRRFETWEEVVAAIKQATDYWNTHNHPYVWGRRRRHRPSRRLGLAAVPKAA
jgi:transposase